jgi:hypothetical protein
LLVEAVELIIKVVMLLLEELEVEPLELLVLLHIKVVLLRWLTLVEVEVEVTEYRHKVPVVAAVLEL